MAALTLIFICGPFSRLEAYQWLCCWLDYSAEVGSSFFFARVLHSLTGDEPASTQAMVVEWKEQKRKRPAKSPTKPLQ